jgi:hypothetical protein
LILKHKFLNNLGLFSNLPGLRAIRNTSHWSTFSYVIQNKYNSVFYNIYNGIMKGKIQPFKPFNKFFFILIQDLGGTKEKKNVPNSLGLPYYLLKETLILMEFGLGIFELSPALRATIFSILAFYCPIISSKVTRFIKYHNGISIFLAFRAKITESVHNALFYLHISCSNLNLCKSSVFYAFNSIVYKEIKE